MRLSCRLLSAALLCFAPFSRGDCQIAASGPPRVAILPPGVAAVWDLDRAYRESTPTRERICVNGLWRWQPASPDANTVPTGDWGYFKVPGCWPGITDYLEKDCQTVFRAPAWKNANLHDITAAWYQREITVPENWARREIVLSADYLNSYAVVYVDGRKAGEMRFPGGETDLTSLCPPGKHTLSLLVVALPLNAVMLAYVDTGRASVMKGSVPRRGLCGDVFLIGRPTGARLDDLKVDTSVRKWQITLSAALSHLTPGAHYMLRARISQHGRPVKQFTSQPFTAADLAGGRFTFSAGWKPSELWDTDTPQNQYDVSVSLLGTAGKLLDVGFSRRFGFREFWIDGRDFYLNGSRIFLSAVPINNAQIGASRATYDAARETMERLKTIGVNFVYTGNYDCEPGSYLSFSEILRAADDEGMLVSFTQPHFSAYKWTAPDADLTNGYAHDAAFFVRAAEDHPSVVAYAMSHNALVYNEDRNPDLIDGIYKDPGQRASNNAKYALRAAAIVHHLDPEKIIYHHAGGNFGDVDTINFYTNFTPIQELDDWFEHWATKGVKPLFLCEYGAPYTWDWTMYRGWYKGQREWGSAHVPWEFCLAEWDAQFLGDRSYALTDMEKVDLRWEAAQFRAGKVWYRWDEPYNVDSPLFDDRQEVFGRYVTDNWRAFRTWGVSATNPWEYGEFWKLRPGVDRSRKDLKVDWNNLQRPGFSPDYIDQRVDAMDQSFKTTDWIAGASVKAMIRNNQPLLGYIGGKAGTFISKDHNFVPGEAVEKQLIVINDSRWPVTCDCQWSVNLRRPVGGQSRVSIAVGDKRFIPVKFTLPARLAPGKYQISATFQFSTGEIQRDSFAINVMAPVPPLKLNGRIALFDPKGETAGLLTSLRVPFDRVESTTDLSGYRVLVIGKGALTLDGPAPDLKPVRNGLKVILFEQTSEVLEKRLGFRVEEYGLRQLFERVPNHPLLSGLTPDNLRDWRGDATILPPRLKYRSDPKFYGAPTVQWCGIDVPRVWRCGCQGNVASVLVEKPARGNFLPILDGGYSLQYSPLMEYREGSGMVLFCQVDVTGRTDEDPTSALPASGPGNPTPALPASGEGENLPPLAGGMRGVSGAAGGMRGVSGAAGGMRGVDPAALRLARNILQYVSDWKPAPERQAVYVGDPAGETYFQTDGISMTPYNGGALSANQVLIVGPGGGTQLAKDAPAISRWLNAGGRLLTLGLDQANANAFLPFPIRIRSREHIGCNFPAPAAGSPLEGVGPADVQNRDPRNLFLITGGATTLGDGVLASSANGRVVFSGLVPWQFDLHKSENLKRTFRRAAFAVDRILGNLGVSATTPLLSRFSSPVSLGSAEQRWLNGLYLDQPIDWDDPYRFFGW